MRRAVALVFVTCVLAAWGCEPKLPEPDSPEARLYRTRCAGCHRLYAPEVMTAAMWRVQLERMRGEFERRGVPPLTPAESAALRSYLERHSLDARSGSS